MARRGSKTLVFGDKEMGGIIHVANIKGGVGKSTVATNLADGLSRKGPTLLVDLDAQGSATHALGLSPASQQITSWELFRKRYSARGAGSGFGRGWARSIAEKWSALQTVLVPWIVGAGDVGELRVTMHPAMDLIPANSFLFKTVRFYHLQNFLYNLTILRNYYKYVVLDTPSVWSPLTRALYCHSDLNLIPVTLNALSTRSLRDYLVNVKDLARRRPNVRVRIVKNEVYGSKVSKVRGKTRTMSENRKFLENLCEQVVIRSNSGVSFLPQSMMFDLEIPESAIVRDAQDEGKPVGRYRRYSTAAKAFDKLAGRVQSVLNTRKRSGEGPGQWIRSALRPALSGATAFVFALVLCGGPPVDNPAAPRPLAPQQLVERAAGPITHRFGEGDALYRIAKYAICRYCAVVPSFKDVNTYVLETIDIHNRTRLADESKISVAHRVPAGTTVRFYPPSHIHNPRRERLIPVYSYFTSMVDDPFAYVTGDWCERGSGGGRPHYGLDVAAPRGTRIIAPVEGTVYLSTGGAAGRTLGIVNGGEVVFFSHMAKRHFSSGQRVEKGEVVGTVGMTGNSSGPHVHVGYGVRTLSGDGIVFGRRRYRLTDPKLFFYRQAYLDHDSRRK